jgi:hypothetical protein
MVESWWDNIDISPRYNKHHKEELTGGRMDGEGASKPKIF